MNGCMTPLNPLNLIGRLKKAILRRNVPRRPRKSQVLLLEPKHCIILESSLVVVIAQISHITFYSADGAAIELFAILVIVIEKRQWVA